MRTLQESRRLVLEEVLAKKHFRHVKVTTRGNDVCFTDWVKGRGFRNRYQLELIVLGGSLDRRPLLFVTSPKLLPLQGDRGTIGDASSHSYHTYSNAGGPVKICFTSSWTASCTCCLALWRGFLWVTAYEVHLVTGETIATIIDRWKEKVGRWEECFSA